MTPTQIAQKISDQLGPAITKSLADDKHPRVHTTAGHWHSLAEFLRHDPDLAFDFLACITAVDYVADNQFCCVYDLYSMKHQHWFAVKVYVDRNKPSIPSVMDLWPAADWHERGGVRHDGHRLPGPHSTSPRPAPGGLGGLPVAEGLRLPARVPRHPRHVRETENNSSRRTIRCNRYNVRPLETAMRQEWKIRFSAFPIFTSCLLASCLASGNFRFSPPGLFLTPPRSLPTMIR